VLFEEMRKTLFSGGRIWAFRPKDDKRSASDDQQVTKRSAETFPPEPRGLRGRGGERPFSNWKSVRSTPNLGDLEIDFEISAAGNHQWKRLINSMAKYSRSKLR
jgi:hypothetical protein